MVSVSFADYTGIAGEKRNVYKGKNIKKWFWNEKIYFSLAYREKPPANPANPVLIKYKPLYIKGFT